MSKPVKRVIARDGSDLRGGPRPDPPARPTKGPAEAETGSASFPPAYTSNTAVVDARRAFENAHGTPSPRQVAEQGEEGGTHDEPGDKFTDGVPVPTD